MTPSLPQPYLPDPIFSLPQPILSLPQPYFPDPVDTADGHGNTLLSEACAGGDLPTVKLLLSRGADPNNQGEFRRTPLFRASFAGHVHLIAPLLEAGADPRVPNEFGELPDGIPTSAEIQAAIRGWDTSKVSAVDVDGWVICDAVMVQFSQHLCQCYPCYSYPCILIRIMHTNAFRRLVQSACHRCYFGLSQTDAIRASLAERARAKAALAAEAATQRVATAEGAVAEAERGHEAAQMALKKALR